MFSFIEKHVIVRNSHIQMLDFEKTVYDFAINYSKRYYNR